MKALSIKQPWLWAITDLDKRIENRSWNPPEWIIGKTIALHASKRDDIEGGLFINNISGKLPPHNLPRGAIVATCRIVGWIDMRNKGSCIGGSLLDDPWFFGPIGWILDDIYKLYKPIPCNGALGLWEWKEC